MASPTQFGEHKAIRSNLFAIEPQALVVDWSKNLSRNGEEPEVDDDLKELARDMMPRKGDSSGEDGSSGQLNPITVRQNSDKKYEVILGYRRMRAALWLVESGECPDFKIRFDIKRMNDSEAAMANMSENLQRRDPKPIQTAHAIRRLNEDYGLPISQIASRLKRSETWCHNTLRLVQLPKHLQDEVANENLGVTAAIALTNIGTEAEQSKAYEEIRSSEGKVTADKVRERDPNKKIKGKGPQDKLRKFLEKKSEENGGGAVLAEVVLQFLDGDETVTIDHLDRFWDELFSWATDKLESKDTAA